MDRKWMGVRCPECQAELVLSWQYRELGFSTYFCPRCVMYYTRNPLGIRPDVGIRAGAKPRAARAEAEAEEGAGMETGAEIATRAEAASRIAEGVRDKLALRIIRLLGDGRKRSSKQIAEELGTSLKRVQNIMPTLVSRGVRRRRSRKRGAEYVYYI